MVVRIAVASIYGGRKGELAQLSSEDIQLDGDKSYISVVRQVPYYPETRVSSIDSYWISRQPCGSEIRKQREL